MPTDPHRSVDDAPFGGGAGMVLGPEPVFSAVERVAASPDGLPRPLVLLSPSGRRFDQRVAEEYAAQADGFSLLCGRYEGVDQRVADHLVDEELSVGDFVLAGGELAALVVVEAVVRLLPGVLGNDDSVGDESFSAGLLEYPQYTRPAEFRGWPVPDTLLSGDHARIDRWRRAQALVRTMRAPARPDRRPGGPAPATRSDSWSTTVRCACCANTATIGEPRRRRLCRYSHCRPGSFRTSRGAGAPGRIWREGARRGRVRTIRGKTRPMNPTDIIDRDSLRDDIPDFRPGDTVKVHVRVVEGTRERVQVFQGAVVKRQGTGVRETFTVRKVSFGVGVERTFPVHSPVIAMTEVVSLGDVRRAKLYYLRDRHGKAAKIKERRSARP